MSIREGLLRRLQVGEQTTNRWLTAALAGLLLACLPWNLSKAGWLQSNAVLWLVAALGVACGLVVARVVRHPTVAIILLAIIGALVVTQYYSRALPPFDSATRELVSIVRWAAVKAGTTVSEALYPEEEYAQVPPPPALPEWQAAGERLQLYIWNLQTDWPPRFVPLSWKSGQVLLGSMLGLLVWMAAALSMWALVHRRSAWGALVPVLGLLAFSIYHTQKDWGYLVIVGSAGVLLAGGIAQRRLANRWQSGAFPYWFEGDWWTWTATIGVLAALAMMLTIGVTDPQFGEWLDETFSPKKTEVTKDRGAGQRASTSPTGGGTSPGIWPRQHLLGSGPELSERPVMTVRTPGIPPTSFYWRASSYDRYTGHGWKRTATSDVVPNRVGPPSDWADPPQHYVLLRQSFRLESSSHQIYATGLPVRLSISAEWFWFDKGGTDLVTVQSITAQSGYEVLSWVPTANPDDLREATTDYPQWIMDGYLALPEELPERVVTLAQDLTAEAPTVFDKALALQSYLRTYEYSLDLPAPPTNRDVIDYFLFDVKRGYCDYYASAMVVMARSVGIPARLAVGYATGEYNPETESYHVTLANGHSWVEIYFPEFGWIRFEPTASLPEVEHGPFAGWNEWTEPLSPEDLSDFDAEPMDRTTRFNWRRLWPLAIFPGILAALAGTVVLVSALRFHRLSQGSPRQIVESLFIALVIRGRRLGVSVSETQTPNEFLAALLGELAFRARNAPPWGGDWDNRQKQAGRAAGRLVALYAEGCYSPRKPTHEMARRLLDAWRQLSRDLWLFWLAGGKRRSE